MKRKIGTYLGVCLLCSIILGGSLFNPIEVISLEVLYAGYPSESRMYYAADIILYGSPMDTFEDRKHVNNYQEGILADFYTLTKFKIKKVIKNATGLKLHNKDIFGIMEPVTIVQNIQGRKMLEMDSYHPMEKNINYIIYLGDNGIGGYSIINMANGKFDMDHDTEEGDYEHQTIRKQVLDQYAEEVTK